MASRDKPILGVFSITLFIAIVYYFFVSPVKTHIEAPFYAGISASLLSGLNIAILFAWLVFELPGGIALSALSVIIVCLLDLRSGVYRHLFFAWPFLFTTFIGYMYVYTKNRLSQSYSLKLEKITEDINILSDDISHKKTGIQSLEEKMQRYSLLKDVVESMSMTLSLDDISRLLIERAVKTLGKTGRALLFLVDTEKQELMLLSSKGASKVKAKQGDVFDSWVLRNRKSLIIEDIEDDFRFSTNEVEGSKKLFKSLISVPLISEDKTIGILRMDNTGSCVYSQDDLRLLDIMANLGAVSVQNAFLYSRTQELARKDSLTGLAVRRYFMARFKEEIMRFARKRGELAVLLLDIDHFKEYNDRYGHASGDIVLKHLARIISSLAKEGDIVGRYGGEEIMVLFCDMGKAAAVAKAETIRSMIKENPLMLRRHQTNITVSIGLSVYPEDAHTEEELMRIADERLYKAKAEGRDRICSA